jgi:PAS domain S-box-containing protein
MSDVAYQRIFDLAPEPLFLLDERGLIVDANATASRVLGYAAHELAGRRMRELLAKGPRKRAEVRTPGASREGDGRLHCVRKDGGLLPCEVRVSRTKGAGAVSTVVALRHLGRAQRAQGRRMEGEPGFRALVENSLDIVTLLEPDGTIRLESPSVKRHLGYEPAELAGRNVFEFVHEEDRERVLNYFGERLQAARQNPELTGAIEFRAMHKDGTPRVFESIGRLIRDEQGRFSVLVNSRDVTGRRRAEQALRESEARFRGVFEGSLDAELIFRASDGRTTEVNQAFSRIYGYAPEEVLGRTAREIGFWARPDDLERFLRDLSERGEVRALETVFRARGGAEISSTITAVKLNLGSQICVLSVIRDITRQKQAEAELAEARDAALESSRLKSAFLANTSHEIRTPLNVILGYSGLIAEYLATCGDHSQDAFLEGIGRAGERLLHTIEHVLDYSRIESGSFEVRPAPLRLAPLIEGLIRDLRVLAAAKGIALEARSEVPEATLMFDEHCLTGALTNLVQNAIKFTPGTRRGRKGTVAVHLRRDRFGDLKLDVRDTGVGIDPRFVPRLFEPFLQEESSHNRRFEGWGLGLALAKKYLELNGASLSVRSKKGAGSTFTVRFAPESEIHAPTLDVADERQPPQPLQPLRRKRPHLLVVEDDADTQAFMAALLGNFYEVSLAASGEEMRRRLVESKVDLVLMDLALSGGRDGLALTRLIASHPQWKRLPVIAVTAYTSADDRARAAAAGCTAYVPKPIMRDRLLATIEAVLASARPIGAGPVPDGDRAA